MLLFPWTFHFHLNAWAYAGQTGRMTDAAAYFSGLGISPAPKVSAVGVDGATNHPAGGPSGDDGEVVLDIDVGPLLQTQKLIDSV